MYSHFVKFAGCLILTQLFLAEAENGDSGVLSAEWRHRNFGGGRGDPQTLPRHIFNKYLNQLIDKCLTHMLFNTCIQIFFLKYIIICLVLFSIFSCYITYIYTRRRRAWTWPLKKSLKYQCCSIGTHCFATAFLVKCWCILRFNKTILH